MQKREITIERAIRLLCIMYGRAITDKTVGKPVSWALYQSWKRINDMEKSKGMGRKKGVEP